VARGGRGRGARTDRRRWPRPIAPSRSSGVWPRRPVVGFVRRHRLVLELALLALVAYLAGVGVTTGLDTAVDDVPPAPAEAAAAAASRAPAPLADYALIAERDVFNPARG